jgi:hypothetical protein
MQDYAAPWFRARRQQGVDDTIYYGMIAPSSGQRYVFSVPHEQCDGVGAFMRLLRCSGVQDWQGITGKPASIPGFFSCLRAQAKKAPAELPNWRRHMVAPVDAEEQFIAIEPFSLAQTTQLRGIAKASSVSVNSLLLTTLHNVIAEQLLVEGGGSWFVPVSLRGALHLPSDEMNHASGIYLSLPAVAQRVDVQSQLIQGLRRNEHWWLWHQARLVAKLGGQWLVGRLLPMLQQRHYLGSFSSMGEWNIDWSDSLYPEELLMWGVPPGSPSYPVAACWLICNGQLVLTLKLNAVLGLGKDSCQSLLRDWCSALTKLLSEQEVDQEEIAHG